MEPSFAENYGAVALVGFFLVIVSLIALLLTGSFSSTSSGASGEFSITFFSVSYYDTESVLIEYSVTGLTTCTDFKVTCNTASSFNSWYSAASSGLTTTDNGSYSAVCTNGNVSGYKSLHLLDANGLTTTSSLPYYMSMTFGAKDLITDVALSYSLSLAAE